MWATADSDELQRLLAPIGTSLAVLEVCADGRFRTLGSNAAHERATGLRSDDIRGRWLEEILPPDRLARLVECCRRCTETARSVDYETIHDLGDGARLAHTTFTPVFDAERRVVRIIASSIDITALRAIEREATEMARRLRDNEERLQLAITGGMLGTWDWDVGASAVHIEEHDDIAFGTTHGGIPLKQDAWKQRIHPEDLPRMRTARQATLRGDTSTYEVEYRLRTGDGWVWIHAYGQVVRWDDQKRPLRACGIYRNVTRQKQQEAELRALNAELEHRATHDGLTGALNHGAALDALQREIARLQRDGGTVSVMLIDIDHFKRVNDTHGHPVGDQVLHGFVERIRKLLRPYDHLGRYGGEEFLIVSPSPSHGPAHAEGLAERLCRAIGDEPFATSAGAVTVTASIGVARGNGDHDMSDWLNRADAALYRAKAEGRDRVVNAEPNASPAPRTRGPAAAGFRSEPR